MRASDPYNPDSTIAASVCDGWLLGYIGIPWPGPWPKLNGDMFVADPNGWQAGIAWESTGPEILQLAGPSPERWGVFQVLFPFPVQSEGDLIRNFQAVLPVLKIQRALVKSKGGA